MRSVSDEYRTVKAALGQTYVADVLDNPADFGGRDCVVVDGLRRT